jgi:N-methylhydantoinase A
MGNGAAPGLIAAVDIGGTFTDAVLVDADGKVAYGKALSSPEDDFESGFLASLDAAGELAGHDRDELFHKLARLVSHGSTVATNIVVEGKGATVGVLTTRGHEDTLEMMRGQGRVTGEPPENILRVAQTSKPPALVPRERIRGVAERIDSLGEVIVPLDVEELKLQTRALLEAGCDAFAICFLWSIQNPEHERRALEVVREAAPEAFVSISSELSSAVGEYERTVATVVNALVGPDTSRYLGNLQARLGELGFSEQFMLMQCHGGMVPLESGAERPILSIGSGPVGGLVGSQRLASELGFSEVIATDMGGTSFDVGLITGSEPQIAAEAVIGKYTYRIPAVEVLSIAAGGGSVAWIEEHSGTLRVGPHSAGSKPGPACYGLGGTDPTVTDADLVLGYLDPDATFGTSSVGQIQPSRELAEEAIRSVAEPLGLSVTDAALGIVEIVNAKLANLLENVVVGRGFDPRDFTIFAFGGSGPLHAAGYASELGVSEVVIPGEIASVWSAFGIAMSDVRFTRERDVQLISPLDPAEMQRAYDELEGELRQLATKASNNGSGMQLRRYARMRYEWQRNELEIPVPSGKLDDELLGQVTKDFEHRYESRYGPASLLPGARYEIVNLRAEALQETGLGTGAWHAASNGGGGGDMTARSRAVAFERGSAAEDVPAIQGAGLDPGVDVDGPAVIDLPTTGILVPPGARASRTDRGDFVLTFGG